MPKAEDVQMQEETDDFQLKEKTNDVSMAEIEKDKGDKVVSQLQDGPLFGGDGGKKVMFQKEGDDIPVFESEKVAKKRAGRPRKQSSVAGDLGRKLIYLVSRNE